MIGLLLACAGPPAAPNILLVSMDTVRFDRTSLGVDRDTSPNLAALAAAGVSFSQAYAVGNESLYSHAALFTGLYPSEVAVPDYGSFALPRTGPATLAEVLTAYGYRTAAFTGGGHVVEGFGFDRGFGRFEAGGGEDEFASFYDSVPPAVAWMREQGDAPWFCFVHGYDAHSPYVQRGPMRHPWGSSGATARVERLLANPLAVEQLRFDTWFVDRTPQDFTHASGRRVLSTDFYRLPAVPGPEERVERLTSEERRHVQDHYDSGVANGDLWLGQLLAHVDLDRTLVIVVADHGEDLLDHGWMNHRAGLWDSTLHVPLVVAGPGFRVTYTSTFQVLYTTMSAMPKAVDEMTTSSHVMGAWSSSSASRASATLMASSKTRLRPACVSAEPSRYFTAPSCSASSCPRPAAGRAPPSRTRPAPPWRQP